MKLYTDHGNFQTLKVLVAAEIGKVALEVKEVTIEGEFRKWLGNITYREFCDSKCTEKQC